MGIDFCNSFKKTVGNGKNTIFWKEPWLCDMPLEAKFSRLFRAESTPTATVADRLQWMNSASKWTWSWTRQLRGRTLAEFDTLMHLLDGYEFKVDNMDRWSWSMVSNGHFTTKVLSDALQSKILPSNTSGIETLRNNLVPKKVGIFVWRALKGRLPVLFELDKRGIDLHSIRCSLGDDDTETIQHSLFHCSKNVEIWERVQNWCGIKTTNLDLSCAFRGESSSQMSGEGVKVWQAVEWTCGYLIWKNMNQKVFKNVCWTPPVALNEIQVKSYEWISKRCKTVKIDWHNWLINPQKFFV
ncbi:uncharacterized protein [Rutidosis leptorrhynchoides]|uniref:uncharacterized protein n=1 Tax=Rutidosis leptorrhynchoides TaxID=125765 RepID=UPI003A9973FE